MNFLIFRVKQDELTLKTVDYLRKQLLAKGHKETDENVNYIFTVGGDGTVIKAFQEHFSIIDDVLFIGIHTGKLGFYTDWLPSQIDEIILRLDDEEKIRIDKYPIIEVSLCADSLCVKEHVINEMTLVNPYSTQVLEVYINDEHFETFRGTGMCISTPSGSSAYNKSLNGAIINPYIPSMQVTEIASINSNAYRTLGAPFILCKEDIIKLIPRDLNRTTITFDNRHLDCGIFQYMECRVSDKTLNFARLKDIHFWNRVKRDFLK